MAERIPVTVLGGFLGSGKTTLLNRLLHDAHGFRVAVVVNEFGAVGIDGAQVAGAEQFVELDNGCLCCAINEDLQRTLRELHVRGGFDHLVVETTGLADPLPVGWTFSKEGLVDNYRLDALVTVVDARNLEHALGAAPEAELQIDRADILVLNKLDLVSDAGAAAEARVRLINTHAPILPATRGDVPWEVLLAAVPMEATRVVVEGRHPHHPSFETWTFQTAGVLDDQMLEDFFYEILPGVYRVKGIVQTNGESAWTSVNAVAGRFEMEVFDGEYPGQSTLVFIGRTLDREDLARRCAGLVA